MHCSCTRCSTRLFVFHQAGANGRLRVSYRYIWRGSGVLTGFRSAASTRSDSAFRWSTSAGARSIPVLRTQPHCAKSRMSRIRFRAEGALSFESLQGMAHGQPYITPARQTASLLPLSIRPTRKILTTRPDSGRLDGRQELTVHRPPCLFSQLTTSRRSGSWHNGYNKDEASTH